MCNSLNLLALTFHDSYYHTLIGPKQCLPCLNQSYLQKNILINVLDHLVLNFT